MRDISREKRGISQRMQKTDELAGKTILRENKGKKRKTETVTNREVKTGIFQFAQDAEIDFPV